MNSWLFHSLTVLLACTVGLIGFLLIRQAVSSSGMLRYPNFQSITFLGVVLVQALFASTVVVNYWEEHYLISNITEPTIRLSIYGMALFLGLTFPLMAILVNGFTGFDAKQEVRTYYESPLSPVFDSDWGMMLVFIALAVVAVGTTVFIYAHLPALPFVLLFAPEEVSRAIFRSTVRFGYGGNIYVYNLIGKTLVPLSSFVAFAYTRLFPKSRMWGLLFIVLSICSVLVLIADLQKAPLLLYLAGLFIVWQWTKGGFGVKTYIVGMLGGVLMVVAQYVIFAGMESMLDALRSAMYRIALGQTAGLYFYLTQFPELHDFAAGGSMPGWIANMLGVDHVDVGRLMMREFDPEGVLEGRSGLMTTLYMGQAYANFGWLGVFAATIYISGLLQAVFVWFVRSAKTPISLGVFGFLAIEIPLMVMRGTLGFVYNPQLIFVLVVGGILYLAARDIGGLSLDVR